MTGPQTFGQLIRKRREQLGIDTTDELAAMIGKDKSWISRLERGATVNLPEPLFFHRLRDTLGLTTKEMIDAYGYWSSEEIGDDDKSDSIPKPIAARLRAVKEWPRWKIKYVMNSIAAMEELQLSIDVDVRMGFLTPADADTMFDEVEETER